MKQEYLPKISIIMPAYNAGQFISDAVESVLAQTFKQWELIIVDDCSKDNTGEIISMFAGKDSRIRGLKNEKNSGASASRHAGVLAAKANWIAFLDSDDCWEKEKLEIQVRLVKQKHAQLVFTASAFMDEKGKELDYILHVPDTINYRSLCKQNLISNSSVLVKKSLFQRYEMVGEGMHEDFACWLNILKHGYTAYGIDQPLLIYRLSKGSKSANKLKAAGMNWNTYRTCGMPILSSAYYMCWYTAKGLIKYSYLNRKVPCITVIGHFGGNECFLDGQTIKTKVFYSELEERTDWKLIKVDTYEKRQPLKLLAKSIAGIVKADSIVVMVHENGNKLYFPLLYLAARFLKKPVYHDVIGGDLPLFVDRNRLYKRYLNSFQSNWVETLRLKKAMEQRGIHNCIVVPNFKRLSADENIARQKTDGPVRFCTFSRVIREKGIEDAIEAVENINASAKETLCCLDIYGQVGNEYKEAFEQVMDKASDAVAYKGMVDYTEGTVVLSSYDALLFPTFWVGECFPGTIVDAFSAGCPVIASDWNSNGEIIDSGENGIIYPGAFGETLKDAMCYAIDHPDRLRTMGEEAYQSCKRYSSETLMPQIINMIEKGLK